MNILDVDGDSTSEYDPQPWTLAVKTPATVVHAVAIVITVLRLFYRWHLSRLSWEDTWAALALVCDIGCLASVWMYISPRNSYPIHHVNHRSDWLLSLTITSVVWFARMSILSSVTRIASPAPKLRSVAYCVGATFLAMDAGLLAQKIFIGLKDPCQFTSTVAIAQLVTDVISDTILVALPIRFLRDMKLARDRRILIISAFSASMLITGVTILHSALLLNEATSVTLIIAHVKTALALFVCNVLVLVTFAYRLYHKSAFDFEFNGNGSGSCAVEFTSVINLPSMFGSTVPPTTSGVQSKSDIAPIRTLISRTSAGHQLNPAHSCGDRAAACPDDEDIQCHCSEHQAGDAND